MKKLLVNALVFTTGAVIGSLVTWKIVKVKYEQIAQEEIDSVKEVFSRRQETYDKAEELVEKTERRINEKPDIYEYAKILTEEGYTDYSNPQKEEEGGGAPVSEEPIEDLAEDFVGPYVISPEEFGMKDENICESLRYYADGVLTDDWNEIIEDVENLVGVESLKTFGQYDDDAVHVRNDLVGKDFEIVKYYANYSDIDKELPPHYMSFDDEDE